MVMYECGYEKGGEQGGDSVNGRSVQITGHVGTIDVMSNLVTRAVVREVGSLFKYFTYVQQRSFCEVPPQTKMLLILNWN